MTSCPGEVFTDHVVDPDFASRVVAAAEFWVEIVQARTKERKDIESPVQPPAHLLPVLELVIGLGAISGFKSPRVEGVAKVVALLAGEGQSHRVQVDVDADDGDDRPEHLLLGLVRDGQVVPEAEQEGLMVGKGSGIGFVEEEIIAPVETGGVVGIRRQVFDSSFISGNPSHEAIKRDEDGG